MKKLILRLIAEAMERSRPLFAVYIKVNGKAIPLVDLKYIRTEFPPKVGECINLLKGNTMYVYEVIRVNYIYHHSSFDMQEGSITVIQIGKSLID